MGSIIRREARVNQREVQTGSGVDVVENCQTARTEEEARVAMGFSISDEKSAGNSEGSNDEHGREMLRNKEEATHAEDQEEVESRHSDDRDPRSITRQTTRPGTSKSSGRGPKLQLERSRSSVRSQRSHLGDGYSHWEDDDDSTEARSGGNGDEANPDKAFEVRFDGDDDPYSPKNKPVYKKWLIVFILSAGSLCVTCASAMYVKLKGTGLSPSVGRPQQPVSHCSVEICYWPDFQFPFECELLTFHPSL